MGEEAFREGDAGSSTIGGWQGEEAEWCSRRSLTKTATFARQPVARSVNSPKAFALQVSDLFQQGVSWRGNGRQRKGTTITCQEFNTKLEKNRSVQAFVVEIVSKR